ncbi:MAG: hypothetical protein V4543_11835 [Bacteroidota bacterium]
MSALTKEFHYYLDNQEELVKIYNGRVLVIRDEKVQGDFANNMDAAEWGEAHFVPGTFLIQLCTPGPDAYTKHFYNQQITFV